MNWEMLRKIDLTACKKRRLSLNALFGLFLSSTADHKTLQLTVNYVDLICPRPICIIWPFCQQHWTTIFISILLAPQGALRNYKYSVFIIWPFLSSIEQKCRYVHLLLCICIIQLFCEQHWTKMSISCGILSSLHLTCGQRKHPKLFNIKTICAQIQNSRKHVTKTTIAKALKNSDFLADWLTTQGILLVDTDKYKYKDLAWLVNLCEIVDISDN